MVLRLATLLSRHGMSVVEADQPLAIRAVQRERVVDAVWLLRRRRHPRHDEPDPVAGPSGSTTRTCPSRSRSPSRVGSRGSVTAYSYHTEATEARVRIRRPQGSTRRLEL